MRIEAFAMAMNIIKNNYPYEMAINSVNTLADRIVINVLKSEDDTNQCLMSLQKKYPKIELVYQPESEYRPLLDEADKKGNGNRFLNITKNYARKQCDPNGYVWLFDFDEELDPVMFKYLKSVGDMLMGSAYWFPFLHYWKDTEHIIEGKYYSAACRLFRNFPVLGDGFTGFSPGQHFFVPNFFVKHHGLMIKERWSEKQKLYPDSDMDKDAENTENAHIYRIVNPIPVKSYTRPLALDYVRLENRKYSNVEIMRLPVFEKMLFCGILANESVIIDEDVPSDKLKINSMRLSGENE